MVFGIAIVLSVLLQYGRFKKQTISEKAHSRLAWVVVYCYNPLVYLGS